MSSFEKYNSKKKWAQYYKQFYDSNLQMFTII